MNLVIPVSNESSCSSSKGKISALLIRLVDFEYSFKFYSLTSSFTNINIDVNATEAVDITEETITTSPSKRRRKRAAQISSSSGNNEVFLRSKSNHFK